MKIVSLLGRVAILTMDRNKESFDFVVKIGQEMLQSGGEISRTEEVMIHVANAFEIEEFDCYVLANGIFISSVIDGDYYGKTLFVPISPMNLANVDAINHLSRQIVAKKTTLDDAWKELERISLMPSTTIPLKIVGYMMGSASFCYLLGGNLIDASLSSIAGLLLALYFIYVVPKLGLSKFVVNILASSMVTLYACLLTAFQPKLNLDTIIMGGIISLVPGVALVVGIRYIFSDDQSSGMIRLVDAFMTALCIAVGVGSMLKIWSWIH